MSEQDAIKWKTFWSTMSDPMHSSSEEAYYDVYAKELRALIGDQKFATVVEIGAGTGTFYERLGFDRVNYTGYDYSSSMVDKFKADFPAADISVAAFSEVKCTQNVDLVFSNGVIQYISLDELRDHLRHFRARLTPSGRIIHASVPWRALRKSYLLRTMFADVTKRSIRQRLVSQLALLNLRSDGIGRWYDMPEVRNVAEREGYDVKLFGSLNYPYRCHFSFKLRS